MEFACELLHTSPAFHSMVCNRGDLPRGPRHTGSAMDRAVRLNGTRTIEGPLPQEHLRSPADGWQCDPHYLPVAEVPAQAATSLRPSVAVDQPGGRPRIANSGSACPASGQDDGWKGARSGDLRFCCDLVHDHIQFGYEHDHAIMTSLEVFNESKGVCRDYAHLAITFCRCMNIPAGIFTMATGPGVAGPKRT